MCGVGGESAFPVPARPRCSVRPIGLAYLTPYRRFATFRARPAGCGIVFANRDPPRIRTKRIDTRNAPTAGATARPAKAIGYSDMSPRPHEGPAEEGLSSSFLRFVHDPEQVECLKTVLSGFCHRCRNSLNGIKMSLYLFRREARGAVPDCWGDLEAIYHQLERLFDHLQAIYRPMPITMVRAPLDDLIDQHVPKWRCWFESRGRTLQRDPPESEVLADFDPSQLGAGLDALAAWRAEAGDTKALTRIAWGVRDGSIEVRWDEVLSDDPPVPVEHADGFTRRDGPASSRGADMLALPILARIVAVHGGRLECKREPWFSVQLRWPQFQQASERDEA